jgi:tRNA A-37 threonylcarbamoyl transferase component Bud32
LAETVQVTLRLRRSLKEEAERLGIDLNNVVEHALEEAVRRRKAALIEEALRGMRRSLGVEDAVEEWVRAVREERQRRAPGVPA